MQKLVLSVAAALTLFAGAAVAQQIDGFTGPEIRVRTKLEGPTARMPASDLPKLPLQASPSSNSNWLEIRRDTGSLFLFRPDVRLSQTAAAAPSCDALGQPATQAAGRMGLGAGCPRPAAPGR
ncbi:hypothetical protein ACFQS7_12655 [Dankookia sp. GCM10030260]|uniref:hypothetical protein n=1 Tax=Dankookia sp. GCM10030260 TaxID=3273390 RepID=UPI00360D043B